MSPEHRVFAITFELDHTGVIRSIWMCTCGKEGSAWGSDIAANDKKIYKRLFPAHLSAVKNAGWGR